MDNYKNLEENVDIYTTDRAETEDIDFDIIISISSDYYEAFITIDFRSEEISISREAIIDALKKKNVIYGLKNDIIDEIVQNPRNINKVSIAEGDIHENGVDGKIEYCFDVETKYKPKLLSHGAVNHKELNYILKANMGDILAKKILPTQEKNGKTVTDKVIRAKKGRYFDFKIGKNVEVSEDGLSLLAGAIGMIKFENGRVSIIKILEINDDIGIATGNIVFEGKVIVRGNVLTGYTITSKEETEVFGVVGGAKITAKSIKIHKGVHSNAKLVSEEDIVAGFMEGCWAQAKGDIICNAIIHCDISCMGRIIVLEKKGQIIGGNLRARREIAAKTIGTEIGVITKLQVGMDDELLNEMLELRKALDESKMDLKKVSEAIDSLKYTRSSDGDKNLKKEIFLNKCLETRKQHILKVKSLERKIKEIYSLIESLNNSNVSGNQIYPGTNIRISNSHYIVKKALNNVKMYKGKGRIEISPLV